MDSSAHCSSRQPQQFSQLVNPGMALQGTGLQPEGAIAGPSFQEMEEVPLIPIVVQEGELG